MSPPLPTGHGRPARPLVICADDFALNAGINEGIAALARRGRITATSVMVLSGLWPASAQLARDLAGCVDIGLHLDWTSDFARSAGHGRSLPILMAAAVSRQLDRQGIRRVIEDQLDRFEAHFGAPPHHVDGHQHVQQFPGIREGLLEVLSRRYGASGRPWLRVSRIDPGAGLLKSRVINAMGAVSLARQARSLAWPHARSLSGVYGFTGGQAHYLRLLDTWLGAVAGDEVMMCHPAASPDPSDSLSPARVWEYEALLSDAFERLLAAHGITLVRGSHAWCRPP